MVDASPPSGAPRLYGELASWWPLMSSPEDYEEEAGIYRRALEKACRIPLHAVLELGSGGGNNALHLTPHYDLTLVDLSPGMLEVSRALNPGCEHLQGDMRTVRLGREFDGVFVHDAVCYMTTPGDLRRAIETAWVHCRPGGAALFAPDYVRETFRAGTDHGGHDGDGRSMRYMEWVWDPDPADTTYTVDYAYLMREADGTMAVEHDRHIEGLFSRIEWVEWLEAVGFEVAVMPLEHSEVEPEVHELFVCVKPPAPLKG